jgi:hypothetical protein
MIRYRSAKSDPVDKSAGVAMVWVTEEGSPLSCGRGVAHSLQYLESGGFSVWQLGHFIVFPDFK